MLETLKRVVPETVKRPIRKALNIPRTLPSYLYWRWKLRADLLFRLDTIDRGLRERPAPATSTPAQRLEIAQRVLSAYRRASDDQIGKPAVYMVSNEWIPLFRKPLQPLLAALESADAARLRDVMDNFFRSSISQGLCGLAVDMAGTFFDSKPSRYMRMQLLIDSVYRFRLLEKLVPTVKPSDLHIEDFGNPYGMFVDDGFLRTGVDYQYYYAYKVKEMLGQRDEAVVAELGGGIGGFAYFISRLQPSGLTYINLDLPEILCISSYLLLNLFPQKRILLYGESERIDTALISRYDIALLPSFVIEQLADDSVDVTFNSYSLAEMDRPTIENYTRHMSRISRQAILHVNHVSNALVSAEEFQFDGAKFELVDRVRALWNLGRKLDCDEFEFWFKRRMP